MPLFKPPEWMTLIRTGFFSSDNGVDAASLVPRFDLLHCHLKGDVALFAIRRLLQAGIEAGDIDRNSFVCGTSFRKFVAAGAVGDVSENFPHHCRILMQDSFDERKLWDEMTAQIVLPRFLNYQERLGVAAVYARDHSLADYLACIQILLDEGFFSPKDAINFLAMHGHFMWGFCGTLKMEHFLVIANKFEFAVMAFLRSGHVSKASLASEYQDRWIAFFLERLMSFVYIELLVSDGLFSWNSDGSYNIAEGVVQGFNCNINSPSQAGNVLLSGDKAGTW